MTHPIEADLRAAAEDPKAFPREFRRESLELIINDEDADPFTKLMAQRELTIRDNGIQIFGIFPTSNEHGPGFTYSVGASRVELPEMLSFYPSIPTNHFVLNRLFQMMLDLKVELPTEVGEVVMVDDVLSDGLQVALTLLSPEEREAAHKKHTCQVDSADVPILHVLLPLPSGEWMTRFIPEQYAIPAAIQSLVEPND